MESLEGRINGRERGLEMVHCSTEGGNENVEDDEDADHTDNTSGRADVGAQAPLQQIERIPQDISRPEALVYQLDLGTDSQDALSDLVGMSNDGDMRSSQDIGEAQDGTDDRTGSTEADDGEGDDEIEGDGMEDVDDDHDGGEQQDETDAANNDLGVEDGGIIEDDDGGGEGEDDDDDDVEEDDDEEEEEEEGEEDDEEEGEDPDGVDGVQAEIEGADQDGDEDMGHGEAEEKSELGDESVGGSRWEAQQGALGYNEFNNDPRPQVDGDHAQKAASAAATAAAAAAVAAAAHLNDDIDEDDDEDEDEDEDEEQDEDDEEDDDEEEDSHHRGRLRRGVGQSRWYMEGEERGVRVSSVQRQPVPHRPHHAQGVTDAKSLTYVDEDRIVFVGDFQIKRETSWVGLGQVKRMHSHMVTDMRGWVWRLMLMPDGNSADAKGFISVFVEHVNKDRIRERDPGFGRMMRLGFTLLPADPSRVRTSDSLNKTPLRHKFTHKLSDFGYPKCWGRYDVLCPDMINKYMTPDGFIRISTCLQDIPEPNIPPNHNSKRETGMVGMQNQGATCYMNSLLQTLYHLPSLRKAVYDMPTEGDDSALSSPLALQRVFYRLQMSDKAVGTKELTKSFGWDTFDSFLQQDVQELNRVLSDHIEQKMKGTPVEGTMQRLFGGTIRSFVKCVNVNFTSAREEPYYDIQLDVKGCRNIQESFAKYVEEEILDGENKYDAGEEHGRQVAKKGVRFTRFPPVLTIHLKRFEFEMTTGNMIKVNDRFAFFRQIDLDQYLDEDAERDSSRLNRYHLHSVLVHSGDAHAGHYFAYIRPEGHLDGGQWCKFNDDIVTQVDDLEAIEGSYGSGPEEIEEKDRDHLTYFPRHADAPPVTTSHGENTSAYMLVYVREGDLPKIMQDLRASPDHGIPKELRERFQAEEMNQQRLQIERNEAHLYLTIRAARDSDLNYLRLSLADEFVRWDDTLKIRVKKKDRAEELMRHVARTMNVPVDGIRIWICCSRENRTYRPESALQGPFDNKLSVEEMLGDTGPPRITHGQEIYNIFVEEVDKYKSVPPILESRLGRESDNAVDALQGSGDGLGQPGPDGEAGAGTDESPLKRSRTTLTGSELQGSANAGGDGGLGEKDEGAGESSPMELDGVLTNGRSLLLDEDARMERVCNGTATARILPVHILLFFKLYEPHVKPAPTLKFVGHSLFKSTDDSSLIAEEAARLGGLPVGTPVDCYEQVTPKSVSPLPLDRTLMDNELQHGDIILFQTSITVPPQPVIASGDLQPPEGDEPSRDGEGGGDDDTGDNDQDGRPDSPVSTLVAATLAAATANSGDDSSETSRRGRKRGRLDEARRAAAAAAAAVTVTATAASVTGAGISDPDTAVDNHPQTSEASSTPAALRHADEAVSSSPASASARSPSPLQQGVAAGDENDPSASNPGGSPATAAPGTSVSTDGDDADHPPVKRSRNSLDSDGGDSCGISPDDDVGPPGQAGEVGRRSGGGVRVGGDGEDVSGGDGTADDTDATSSAVGGAARVSWATGRNPTVEGVENGQGGDAVVNEPASVMEDGESQSMDEELKDEELPTWAGLAGSRRYLAEGVWRVAGNPETVRKFFEQKVSKRVVHFVGKTARESVLLREGSCTEDGRRPGITIELPRLASYREMLETLWRYLEGVDNPLQLRLAPMTPDGKAQTQRVPAQLTDLGEPQFALHKYLEMTATSHHGNTLIFELLPFPLDRLAQSSAIVEVFCSDTVLKRHCLEKMEKQPYMKIARRRIRARRARKSMVADRSNGEEGRAISGANGCGGGTAKLGEKRKLRELVGGSDGSIVSSTQPGSLQRSPEAGVNGHDTRKVNCSGNGPVALTCEDIVVRPPGPSELVAVCLLVQLHDRVTVMDVLRKLANELKLPYGQEQFLRMMSTGNSDISAYIDKDDIAQSIFSDRQAPPIGPFIKEPPLGTFVLELCDDEELAATGAWGRLPMEPSAPAWMPLQVVTFTVNVNGSWIVPHSNPLITFVLATDDVEDVLDRVGRRRGLAALEVAGLRRGRPAVIDNFRATYLDEERQREEVEASMGLPRDCSPPRLPPPPPAPSSDQENEDSGLRSASHQVHGIASSARSRSGDVVNANSGNGLGLTRGLGSQVGGSMSSVMHDNGFLENGARAIGTDATGNGGGDHGVSSIGVGREGGAPGTLLWRLLRDRFPHHVNKGVEDEPLRHGKIPTLGFKKDNPNEQNGSNRKGELGIRIRAA